MSLITKSIGKTMIMAMEVFWLLWPMTYCLILCQNRTVLVRWHSTGIKDFYVCAYYRPHISDQHSLEQLNISLAKVQECKNNPTVLLAGDFNAPHIDWQSFSVKPGSSYFTVQNSLIDIVQDHGLSQVVMEPTRIDNILDLFFTTNPSQIKKVEIQPGLSDHNMVLIQLNCKPIILRQMPRQILLFNK